MPVEGSLDPRRLLPDIALRKNLVIDANTDLAILGEIQEIPRTLTSLKFLGEEVPEVEVAAAGIGLSWKRIGGG